MMRPAVAASLLALALACGGEPPLPESGAGANSSPASSTAFPTLPDSLVLTAPDGATVWFAGARIGTDSLGTACTERGLVIVRDGSRTLVPLLMTGVPPVLVNDTTMRARIWLHCRPGNTYEVDLRTGTPTRVQ